MRVESPFIVEVSSQITLLKELNQQAYNLISSYWMFPPTDISAFFAISNFLIKAKSLWEESLARVPNSVLLCEGYATYLIDCEHDFEKAIQVINRRSHIQAGKSFIRDYSFRSLVYSFSHYLCKQIVNTNGSILNNERSLRKGPSTESFADDVLQMNENDLAASIMSKSKIDCAYQKAIQNKKSNYSFLMKVWCIVVLLLSIGVDVFIIYFNSSIFDKISEIMNQQLLQYK
jgi:hypothetical protein